MDVPRRIGLRVLLLCGVLCMAAGAWTPAELQAQTRWQQTVEVIVPIEDDGIMQTLVDSMTTVFENENAWIKRSPELDSMQLAELEKQLSSDGLSMVSASHVFITYRYQLADSGLESQIVDLHFIYRPPGAQEDLSIFYVDLANSPLYEELMVEQGTTVPSNEMAFLRFEEQISFHRLAERATVVRLGDEIIRDEERAAAEKERILDVTSRLAHGGLG